MDEDRGQSPAWHLRVLRKTKRKAVTLLDVLCREPESGIFCAMVCRQATKELHACEL